MQFRSFSRTDRYISIQDDGLSSFQKFSNTVFQYADLLVVSHWERFWENLRAKSFILQVMFFFFFFFSLMAFFFEAGWFTVCDHCASRSLLCELKHKDYIWVLYRLYIVIIYDGKNMKNMYMTELLSYTPAANLV